MNHLQNLKDVFYFLVPQVMLAILNSLQNSNVVNRSRDTVLFMPFNDQNVTQFWGFMPSRADSLKEASVHVENS